MKISDDWQVAKLNINKIYFTYRKKKKKLQQVKWILRSMRGKLIHQAFWGEKKKTKTIYNNNFINKASKLYPNLNKYPKTEKENNTGWSGSYVVFMQAIGTWLKELSLSLQLFNYKTEILFVPATLLIVGTETQVCKNLYKIVVYKCSWRTKKTKCTILKL